MNWNEQTINDKIVKQVLDIETKEEYKHMVDNVYLNMDLSQIFHLINIGRHSGSEASVKQLEDLAIAKLNTLPAKEQEFLKTMSGGMLDETTRALQKLLKDREVNDR